MVRITNTDVECFLLPHHAWTAQHSVSIFRTWLSLTQLPAVDEARRVVELPVWLVPPEVLPGVLQRSQRQNDTDGDQSYLGLESIHHRDKVQNSQAHKVDVCQAVKLLKEVHGDEEEEGVFGGLDGVAVEVAVGLLPFLQAFIRQVGHQVAEVLLPRPLTSQSISDQSQRAPPHHGCSACFLFPLLTDLSFPSS